MGRASPVIYESLRDGVVAVLSSKRACQSSQFSKAKLDDASAAALPPQQQYLNKHKTDEVSRTTEFEVTMQTSMLQLHPYAMDPVPSKPRAKPPSQSLHLLKSGKNTKPDAIMTLDHALWQGDVEAFLKGLPSGPLFDLIVTSPPYNIGKEYEARTGLEKYLEWQERIIDGLIPRLKPGGSICWQVGNYVDNNEIFPLDIEFAPIFKKHKLRLRNRIIWQFGHGLHTQRRFSGRYEVVLWYTHTETKKDPYTFNLDPVRIAAKYPGKKHFKGPNAGQFSGNPLGKNPEDVWNIPNVKSNHVEKTEHPCQFPVGLIERLILALTNPGDLVFDPFSGVASSGVAAAIHGRRFWGCEPMAEYAKTGARRLQEALDGTINYRPHDKPLYDHTQSNLSRAPEGFRFEDTK